MRDSSTYKPNLSFGLLLLGPPKTGKTSIALQFPDVYIADCDNNLSGAVRHLKAKGKLPPFRYDTITIDDSGTPVPPKDQWNRLWTCCKAAALDPTVKTVVVDSASTMCDMLCNRIIDDKPAGKDKDKMTISDWVPFKNMLTQFIVAMRSSQKYFILTCHEMIEKDEVKGTMLYKPAIPSRLQDSFGAFFSDVWLTKVEDRGGKLSYIVRSAQDSQRQQLGNSLGLPLEFEFTWDGLVKFLNTDTKPQPK